jgi:hypothetical protein
MSTVCMLKELFLCFWLELVDKMPDNPRRVVFEST